jgi:hypothetical protein
MSVKMEEGRFPKPIFEEGKVYDFDDPKNRHRIIVMSDQRDTPTDIPITIDHVDYEYRRGAIFTRTYWQPEFKAGNYDYHRGRLVFNKEGIKFHADQSDVPTEVSLIDVMPTPTPPAKRPLSPMSPMSPASRALLESIDDIYESTDEETTTEEEEGDIEFFEDGIQYTRNTLSDIVVNEDDNEVGTWDTQEEKIKFTGKFKVLHRKRVKARQGKPPSRYGLYAN